MIIFSHLPPNWISKLYSYRPTTKYYLMIDMETQQNICTSTFSSFIMQADLYQLCKSRLRKKLELMRGVAIISTQHFIQFFFFPLSIVPRNIWPANFTLNNTLHKMATSLMSFSRWPPRMSTSSDALERGESAWKKSRFRVV